MEHRTITGGWHYLPFARNRIQQLRAAGLTHATDRKVFPDAIVTVRLVDGIDYIHIEGGGCSIPMDSGVVDIGVYASEEDPARFLAATLHESYRLATYNAPFALDGAWRLNPGRKSAGQFSGLLTKASYFKGKVPVNGQAARSFSPRKIQSGAVFVDDPADPKLPQKKTVAMRCPASMFTGKTRLYAQAMFGQYLYPPPNLASDGSVTSATSAEALAGPSFNDTAPPSLLLQAYKEAGDETSYPGVVLTTNCGVHLDADGNHWLFEMLTDELNVYPLIGSTCAQGMRKYLAATQVTDPISAVDREHLEAYILSTCRPWVKNKVRVRLTRALATYSMGYGWHWNWSGTACDMVVNSPFDQGGDAIGMRSTHYRTSVQRVGASWQAISSIVEGPVDWTVLRPIWVITEPSWINLAPLAAVPQYTLIKTTYRTTTQIACDAPFYCFYARDELKVCRVSVSYHAATPSGTVWTPGFRDGTGPDNPGFVRYETVGLYEGFTETHTGFSAYWEAQFSCGDEVFSGLQFNRIASGNRIEIVQKTKTSAEPTMTWGDNVDTWEFEFGEPPRQIFRYRGYFSFQASVPVRYRLQYFDYQDHYQSRAAVVVPFYDAEAVYIQAEAKLVRTKTDGMSELQEGERFVFLNQAKYEDGSLGPVLESWWTSDTNFNAVIEPFAPFIPDTDEIFSLNSQRLVHRGGAVDADYGADLDAFFDNEADRVGATFKTLSSTHVTEPVVIGRCEPVGTDVHIGNIALVGAI